MPYSTTSELPAYVRKKPPKKQRQWMHVFNSEYAAHGDESRAFASANGVVKKAWQNSEKSSKQEAHYHDKSIDAEHCAVCTMFRAPHSCTAVKGVISPAGWCKFFERKEMDKFSLFLPLSKVEKNKDGSCTVSGYASTPALDLDGEIVSIDAVKAALPGYWQWRNIREMHTASAVGVAKEANVDDKGLFLTSKIIDPVAVQKCLEGVYKGYSIGGKKLAKNGDIITEIELVEVSIVDRPANPECKIEVQKRAKEGAAWLVKSPRARALKKLSAAVEALSEDEAPPVLTLTKGGDKPGEGKLPYGDVEYADNGLQSDGKKRYPIDTEAHIRAAWNYINKPKNAAKYGDKAGQVKSKIISAWKSKIDAAGPPSAKDKAAKKAKKLAKREALVNALASAPFLTLDANSGETTKGNDRFGHGPIIEETMGKGALFTKRERKILKRMGTAANLSYCFDQIRSAQRELISEGRLEGNDTKDHKLAEKLGHIASDLAAVIGQKASHEGGEALTLGDVDDRWLNLGNPSSGSDETAKFLKLSKRSKKMDALEKLLQKARTPVMNRVMGKKNRLMRASDDLKKARKAVKDVEDCMKALHAAHKMSYMAKAAKKPPVDDNDADMEAMKKLNKAYGSLQMTKTLIKSARTQLAKAAGRTGQRGQEVGDAESGFYEVPPGVKDLSPSALATASPGGEGKGGEPAILGMEQPFPGKSARLGKKGKLSTNEAELLVRLTKAETEAELLKSLPAGPVHGKTPYAFNVNALAGNNEGGKNAVLLKGVNPADLGSEDEATRTAAIGKVLGNQIMGGLGKSMFDAAFHGTAGGNN